jgi:hypothetical protein
MPNYMVDGGKQSMVSTGVVAESADMQQAADKSWSNVGQRRCPDTGMPLWDVEVSMRQETWGRPSSVVAMVSVPAADAPVAGEYAPIRFEGLRVTVTLSRSKSLVERWAADGIASAASAASAAAGGGKRSGSVGEAA